MSPVADWNFELAAGPYDGGLDGPLWDGQGLLFTAPAQGLILRYDPGSGQASQVRRFSSRTTGLAYSPEGLLYGAQSGSRRIARFHPDGSTTQLEVQLDGEYHNHPHDLVADGQRRIWFSDPHSEVRTPGPQIFGPLSHAAVLRQQHPTPPARDWEIQRMTFDTTAPGALLLSKDEGTLYVAENGFGVGDKRELRAYPINDDGNLGDYTVLHTFGSDSRGPHRGIGGMCLDSQDNIVACAGWSRSGPGPTVYVFSPQGRVLESHPVPSDSPTNCAFGGEGLTTLYVTTGQGQLFKVGDTGRTGWVLYPNPAS
jgi:gluconolactonase